MNNCGISRWDDPNEINARLKALTSQPIWEVTDEYYNNVIQNYFDEKCKASKAVYEESKEYIPGGVQLFAPALHPQLGRRRLLLPAFSAELGLRDILALLTKSRNSPRGML